MANERSASDVCPPALTPDINAKFAGEKHSNVNLNGGGGNVEYTLKPAARSYASTARYIHTHIYTLSKKTKPKSNLRLSTERSYA